MGIYRFAVPPNMWDAFAIWVVEDARRMNEAVGYGSPLSVNGVAELMDNPAVGAMLRNRLLDFTKGWEAAIKSLEALTVQGAPTITGRQSSSPAMQDIPKLKPSDYTRYIDVNGGATISEQPTYRLFSVDEVLYIENVKYRVQGVRMEKYVQIVTLVRG